MVRSKFGTLLLCCALMASADATAQDVVDDHRVSPPPPASSALVPADTVVVVELTDALSTKKARAGDHFGLTLVEPIMVNGAIVAPSGITGVGEVIDAKSAGLGGRPGRLILAARYLDNGGQRLNLKSFKLGGGGRDNTELAVGVLVVVGVVGALVEGGDVSYPIGTRATAKIRADTTLPVGSPPASPTPPKDSPSPP